MVVKRKTIFLALLVIVLLYFGGSFYNMVTRHLSREIFFILMFPVDFLLGFAAAMIVGRILKTGEYVSYGISFVVLFGMMTVFCLVGEKIGHYGGISLEDVERYEWFRWNIWVYLPQVLPILSMLFACITHIAFLAVTYTRKRNNIQGLQ